MQCSHMLIPGWRSFWKGRTEQHEPTERLRQMESLPLDQLRQSLDAGREKQSSPRLPPTTVPPTRRMPLLSVVSTFSLNTTATCKLRQITIFIKQFGSLYLFATRVHLYGKEVHDLVGACICMLTMGRQGQRGTCGKAGQVGGVVGHEQSPLSWHR